MGAGGRITQPETASHLWPLPWTCHPLPDGDALVKPHTWKASTRATAMLAKEASNSRELMGYT